MSFNTRKSNVDIKFNVDVSDVKQAEEEFARLNAVFLKYQKEFNKNVANRKILRNTAKNVGRDPKRNVVNSTVLQKQLHNRFDKLTEEAPAKYDLAKTALIGLDQFRAKLAKEFSKSGDAALKQLEGKLQLEFGRLMKRVDPKNYGERDDIRDRDLRKGQTKLNRGRVQERRARGEVVPRRGKYAKEIKEAERAIDMLAQKGRNLKINIDNAQIKTSKEELNELLAKFDLLKLKQDNANKLYNNQKISLQSTREDPFIEDLNIFSGRTQKQLESNVQPKLENAFIHKVNVDLEIKNFKKSLSDYEKQFIEKSRQIGKQAARAFEQNFKIENIDFLNKDSNFYNGDEASGKTINESLDNILNDRVNLIPHLDNSNTRRSNRTYGDNTAVRSESVISDHLTNIDEEQARLANIAKKSGSVYAAELVRSIEKEFRPLFNQFLQRSANDVRQVILKTNKQANTKLATNVQSLKDFKNKAEEIISRLDTNSGQLSGAQVRVTRLYNNQQQNVSGILQDRPPGFSFENPPRGESRDFGLNFRDADFMGRDSEHFKKLNKQFDYNVAEYVRKEAALKVISRRINGYVSTIRSDIKKLNQASDEFRQTFTDKEFTKIGSNTISQTQKRANDTIYGNYDSDDPELREYKNIRQFLPGIKSTKLGVVGENLNKTVSQSGPIPGGFGQGTFVKDVRKDVENMRAIVNELNRIKQQAKIDIKIDDETIKQTKGNFAKLLDEVQKIEENIVRDTQTLKTLNKELNETIRLRRLAGKPLHYKDLGITQTVADFKVKGTGRTDNQRNVEGNINNLRERFGKHDAAFVLKQVEKEYLSRRLKGFQFRLKRDVGGMRTAQEILGKSQDPNAQALSERIGNVNSRRFAKHLGITRADRNTLDVRDSLARVRPGGEDFDVRNLENVKRLRGIRPDLNEVRSIGAAPIDPERFRASQEAVKRLRTKIAELNLKLKESKGKLKDVTKSQKEMASTTKRLTKESTRNNKELNASKKRLENVKKTLKKVSDQQGVYSKQIKKNTTEQNRAAKATNRNMGVTGLAFGFLAGAAGFAAQRATRFFTNLVKESTTSLDSVHRAVLRTIDLDTFLAGDRTEYDLSKNFVFTLGSGKTIFDVGEIGKTTEEVARATGTELSDAAREELTFTAVKLATIEPEINIRESAIGLSKLNQQFGKTEIRFNEFFNTIVALNDESAISLGGLNTGIGTAAASAKKLGLDLAEVGALVAINFEQGAKSGAASGTQVARFIEDVRRRSSKLEEAGFNIFEIDENGKKNYRDANEIIIDLIKRGKELESELGEVDADKLFRQIFPDQRGFRVFTRLLEADIDRYLGLLDAVENAEDVDLGNQLYQSVLTSPLSRLKQLENSIKTIKFQIADGLTPVLLELQSVLGTFDAKGQFIIDKDLLASLSTIGQSLGKNLISVIKPVIEFLKQLTGILKDHPALVDIAVKAFVALGVALQAVATGFGILAFKTGLDYVLRQNGINALFLRNRLGLLGKSILFVNNAMRIQVGNAGRALNALFLLDKKGFIKNIKSMKLFGKIATQDVIKKLKTIYKTARASPLGQVGASIVKDLGNAFKPLLKKIAGYGVVAGGIFGAGFGFISEKIIGFGRWIKGGFSRLAALMAPIGALLGGIFGVSFGRGSNAAVAVAGKNIGNVFKNSVSKLPIAGLLPSAAAATAGASFGTKILNSLKGGISGIPALLGSAGNKGGSLLLQGITAISKAGPIGLVVAAAIAVGAAIALALDNAVKESNIFKTGLADYWQVAQQKLLSGVGKTVRDVGKFFFELGQNIIKIWEGIAQTIDNVVAILAALAVGDFSGAHEAFIKAQNDFDDFSKYLTDGIKQLAKDISDGATDFFGDLGGSIFTPDEQAINNILDVIETALGKDKERLEQIASVENDIAQFESRAAEAEAAGNIGDKNFADKKIAELEKLLEFLQSKQGIEKLFELDVLLEPAIDLGVDIDQQFVNQLEQALRDKFSSSEFANSEFAGFFDLDDYLSSDFFDDIALLNDKYENLFKEAREAGVDFDSPDESIPAPDETSGTPIDYSENIGKSKDFINELIENSGVNLSPEEYQALIDAVVDDTNVRQELVEEIDEEIESIKYATGEGIEVAEGFAELSVTTEETEQTMKDVDVAGKEATKRLNEIGTDYGTNFNNPGFKYGLQTREQIEAKYSNPHVRAKKLAELEEAEKRLADPEHEEIIPPVRARSRYQKVLDENRRKGLGPNVSDPDFVPIEYEDDDSKAIQDEEEQEFRNRLAARDKRIADAQLVGSESSPVEVTYAGDESSSTNDTENTSDNEVYTAALEQATQLQLIENELRLAINEHLTNYSGLMEENITLVEEHNELNTTLNDLYTQLNEQAQAAIVAFKEKVKSTLVLIGSINLLNAQIAIVRAAFINLKRQIDALAARIARTKVVFEYDENGTLTDFKLVGGINRADAQYYGREFATGGIVTKAVRGIVGEAGPEAVLPLSRLPEFLNYDGDGKQVVNNINVEVNPNIVIENGRDIDIDSIVTEINERVGEELVSKVGGLVN